MSPKLHQAVFSGFLPGSPPVVYSSIGYSTASRVWAVVPGHWPAVASPESLWTEWQGLPMTRVLFGKEGA